LKKLIIKSNTKYCINDNKRAFPSQLQRLHFVLGIVRPNSINIYAHTQALRACQRINEHNALISFHIHTSRSGEWRPPERDVLLSLFYGSLRLSLSSVYHRFCSISIFIYLFPFIFLKYSSSCTAPLDGFFLRH